MTTLTCPRRTLVEQVMGLPVSVVVRGPAVDTESFFAELHEVDARFSTYREASEISRLRRGELRPEQCHPDVHLVLERCRRARDETEGRFDCLLPALDPSGLVKGWAVERATRHLAGPTTDWCVTAGGDVVATCLPDRPSWRIGIEDPHDRSRVLQVVELRDGAVATSGTAARGLHIVDPRSGEPADRLASVTVRGPSLERADVLATAAFVEGPGAVAWLARFPGHEALLVGRDGRVATSSGWPAHDRG